jgi:hypothetical protein
MQIYRGFVKGCYETDSAKTDQRHWLPLLVNKWQNTSRKPIV